jgi:hypothetical protein
MHWRSSQVGIPTFVRIKPGALGRLGIYAQRQGYRKPVFFVSAGLPESVTSPVGEGFEAVRIRPARWVEVGEASFEIAASILAICSLRKKFVAVASGAARRANHHTETQIPVSERTAHPAPADPPLPLEYVAMFRVMLVSALSSTALTTAMFDELGSGVRRRT